MKYQKLILAIIFFLFFMRGYSQEPSLQIGDPAPKLYLAKWLKGKAIESFQPGQIYVMEFWATWCKPCLAGMPHLSQVAKEYRNQAHIVAVSVMERKTTDIETISKFVSNMGDKMDFSVAVEEDRNMTNNWLNAAGERSIPNAIIVNREGKVAWIGHSGKLNQVLPTIIAGNWNLDSARENRAEKLLTAQQDGALIEVLNPYMGNPGNPKGALEKIAEILKENPSLKYAPHVGHFTFWSLLKTDPEKALEYGKAWIAASDEPSFKTITDAVYQRQGLPPALYVFAADAFQEQLDRYPWSMNFEATYRSMAELYEMAGDQAKAQKMLQNAETIKKETQETKDAN